MIFYEKTGGYMGQYEEKWIVEGGGKKAKIIHEWSHTVAKDGPTTFGTSTYTVQEFLRSDLDRGAVNALKEALEEKSGNGASGSGN